MDKLKIFPFPTGLHSFAMTRVERALSKTIQDLSNPLSSQYQITCSPERADIVILHVIGLEAIEEANRLISQGKKYIVIQYCGCSGDDLSPWHLLWKNSLFVWSYYDLSSHAQSQGFRFYYAPLGIDEIFTIPPSQSIKRRNRIMTSGYVSHPSQEPIQEVWLAAERLGIEIVHLGPSNVTGVTHYPDNIIFIGGISDNGLRDYYHSCKWVSALRHIEGFELPAIEGLSCGARPLCFPQVSIQYWYGGYPWYVRESTGKNLADSISQFLLANDYVSQSETKEVRKIFDWTRIIGELYAILGDLS